MVWFVLGWVFDVFCGFAWLGFLLRGWGWILPHFFQQVECFVHTFHILRTVSFGLNYHTGGFVRVDPQCKVNRCLATCTIVHMYLMRWLSGGFAGGGVEPGAPPPPRRRFAAIYVGGRQA